MAEMFNTQDLAQEMLDKLNGLPENDRQQVFIDPLTIMMIGSIISTAITITKALCEIRQARKAKSAIDAESNPLTPELNIIQSSKRGSILAQIIARRSVKRTMGKSNPQLENVLLSTCAQLSPQQLYYILNENGYYN
jgi:hypothetical protein